MSKFRYDGRTVVVTGAGRGLGRAYALFYGSRGANVVVNDFGGTLKGIGEELKIADQVVKEIQALGGKAVASYDTVENGAQIIETAIQAFGRIDVLINNAGILRDVSFKNMAQEDWTAVISVHLDGCYSITRSAWPYFRKQKYGRVINTSSATGLFGNFGQVNYGAAKMAVIGFSEALAKEGAKKNILCNVVVPMAATRMTATVMGGAGAENDFSPATVVPLVGLLTHETARENGSIFEAGGGHFAKIRWQRSRGVTFRPDESFTPGAVLSKWDAIRDFSQSDFPHGPVDLGMIIEQSAKLAPNPSAPKFDFSGRVAVVTGGGAGIGRAYCLYFARLGAAVVVNDLVDTDIVVQEIKNSGGQAVGVKANVLDGELIIQTAVKTFGRVDILVNNAGIIRDKAFHNMTEKQWRDVVDVHLHGTYQCTKAAFPVMLKQNFGRVINTTSPSGIYGTFGQVNYSAAKAGIIGLTRSLALEGVKNHIIVNAIAPTAATQMTATIMPPDLLKKIKAEYICPLVAVLASEKAPATGLVFEVGAGWQAELRWQRSGGVAITNSSDLTPEYLQKELKNLVNFDDGRADYPKTQGDARKHIMGVVALKKTNVPAAVPTSANKWLAAIKKAKNTPSEGTSFEYSEKDSILYNLSVGAKRLQLPFLYENDPNFQLLPTFGVVPYFGAKPAFRFQDIVPDFKPMSLLHGEQYLEIRTFPIPVNAKTVSTKKLLEVVDKGNAALIVTSAVTKLAATGEHLFYNEEVVFIRGSGGFDGPKRGGDRGAATMLYKVPQRSPDATFEDLTSEEQAALYRLNGDRNPLHIDPEQSKKGGFQYPILHGLCSFGITGRRIVEKFGLFKNIKVRFTGVVIPGQTLRIELWKDQNTVIFQTTVKDTGKVCISGGAQLASISAKLA